MCVCGGGQLIWRSISTLFSKKGIEYLKINVNIILIRLSMVGY